MNKEDIVNDAVLLLLEFVQKSGTDFSHVYFRLARENEHCRNSVWVARSNKLHIPFSLESDLEDRYTDALDKLILLFMDEIANEHESYPKVVLLAVEKSGHYDVKVDYDDIDALQIDSLSLGLENSIFKEDEIDIYPEIIKLQKSLGRRK
jgi:hypothetical protein